MLVRIGIALSTVGLLAGCTAQVPPGPQVDASRVPDPAIRQELLAAIPDMADGAYAFRISGPGAPVSGVFSDLDSVMQVTQERTVPGRDLRMTVTARRVGAPVWVRVALEPASWHRRLGVPTGWTAIDQNRLPAEKLFPVLVDSDGGDVAEIRDTVRFATEVWKAAPGRFTGTVDLRTVDRTDSIVPRDVVDRLGERAAAVPFEVTVTGGVASGMTVTLPDGAVYRVEYSGFGATTAPGKIDAGRAPKSVYALL
ncbi:hypothetical protein [Actinoplanes lobatus]|uniref:Putative lipoprotein YbaY n=1 Tax=Actinoplanes lobatus TaxID=113568 RepID=A0A7W7HMI1_9ACTN|nr:hypothetical protein [Actinoplanes lobatus]MBB4753267.1 putative lipoprotein YbaY [Actinoplanes lobatus]